MAVFEVEWDSHARSSLWEVLLPQEDDVGPVCACPTLTVVVVWISIGSSPPGKLLELTLSLAISTKDDV